MGCCTTVLHLSEDNARFLLLAVVAVIYMLLGALLFQILEEDGELRMGREYWNMYYEFRNESSRLLCSSLEDGNSTIEVSTVRVIKPLKRESASGARSR